MGRVVGAMRMDKEAADKKCSLAAIINKKVIACDDKP
jgi:hypothetical protein